MIHNQNENQELSRSSEVANANPTEPSEPQNQVPPERPTHKYGYGYYAPPQHPIERKQPAITYIFVTSLILMILLAYRLLIFLADIPTIISDLEQIRTQGFSLDIVESFENIAAFTFFSVIVLIGATVCSLLLLIFSVQARSKNASLAVRARASKAIKITAIIFLVTLCLHLIVEYITYAMVVEFFESYGILTVVGLEAAMMGVFLELGTYIGLQIAGIVKASTYRIYIEEQLG